MAVPVRIVELMREIKDEASRIPDMDTMEEVCEAAYDLTVDLDEMADDMLADGLEDDGPSITVPTYSIAQIEALDGTAADTERGV